MLKLWGLCALLLVFAAPAMAQVTPESTDQQTETPETQATPATPKIFPKYNLSAGYTLQIYKTATNGPHLSLQGWYGSVEYNFFSWLGAEGQFSGDYRYQPYPTGDISIYSAMAGPRIYPLRHHKLEPWAHFLYGGAVYVSQYPIYIGFPRATYVYSSKAWEFGGGFDLNQWKHWGIRLIEIDYGHTEFFGSHSLPSYRLAVGFTYNFGEK
ncbi:MAG: hypothetical protein ACLQMT_02650 [Candidatus Acidiferrales bacterium]